MIYKRISIVCFILLVGSYISLAWTENGEWESGSSILWDVPHQSQAYFRNWSTACSATSRAMIINFMYSGAHFTNFSGSTSGHPWTPIIIAYPYATTGQRVYSLGTYEGNSFDAFDGNLLDYLIGYPKNGIKQYYCTTASCTGANYGPLHNETSETSVPGVEPSITNCNCNTGGNNAAMNGYLYRKHNIEVVPLGSNFITNIRNALYKGPVIISVWRLVYDQSHVIAVKGVNTDGNFIINDPWGGDIYSPPGNILAGSGVIYEALQNGKLGAYGYEYWIKYAYSIPVIDNFNRANSAFSPWSIPVEAALTFNYDASGELNNNNNYDGDGDYSYIKNRFSFSNYESGQWNYFYNQEAALGFPYTTTTQGETVTADARWTPYIPRSGRYRVLVGFFAHPDNSTEVHYIVYHRDGQENLVIDQKNDTNAYEVRGNIVYKSLGNYYFNEGASDDNGSVQVINTSNVSGDINVDIVRFAYPPFPDINKCDWFHNYVLCLYCLGIVSGHPDGHFRPNETVNRAEFIKMVVLALETAFGQELFGYYFGTPPWDLDPSQWYYTYVMKAYIYKNYNIYPPESIAFWSTNQSLDFSQGVTREEAAHIVRNALELSHYSPTGIPVFTDVPINHAGASWIYKIREAGIIDGYDDKTFQPSKVLNRAEAAKIIRNMLEYKGYINYTSNNIYPDICNKEAGE